MASKVLPIITEPANGSLDFSQPTASYIPFIAVSDPESHFTGANKFSCK